MLIWLLIIDESFLHTLNAHSDVGHIMCNAPTRSAYNPAFFEKLCRLTARSGLISHPYSAKWGEIGAKRTHLTHKHGDASAGELSDCPGILIQIAAGEALIRTVEECKVTFLHHNVGDCVPLVPRRIHPSGVVGASVENHDRPVGDVTKCREEATKVQPVRNGVVIRVGFHPEPHPLKNRMVVYCNPRRRKDNENTFE